MKSTVCLLVVLAILGLAHAQYATLSEAVQKVPELSDLARHTKGNAFEKSLNDPNFVGTIFAPTNAALKKVSEAIGMDIFELASDPEQIEGVLDAALVPGKAWSWKDIKECQKLTAKGGNVLQASWVNPQKVKLEAAGAQPTLYINGIAVTQPDITAGKAAVFLMSTPIVPKDYEDMLSGALNPEADAASDAPKKYCDPKAPASPFVATSSPAVAVPDGKAVDAAPPATSDGSEKGPTPAASPATDSSKGAVQAPADTSKPADQRSSASSFGVALAMLAVPAVAALVL